MKLHFATSVVLVFCAVAFTITPAQASLIKQRSSPTFRYSDALIPPDLPARSFETSSEALAPSLSPSPGYYETSEYLIGNVAVGIVLLESNGHTDPSSEDWTSTQESQVVNEISSGLSWLANYNPNAHVSLVYDIHYRIPTNYEPIKHSHTYEEYWISDAMTYLGYSGSSYFTQARDYINNLRNTLDTDWAFAIFIVNSYNDSDGMFADGKYFAYAYLGGPFLVMTYDNDAWGIENMDNVIAHETLHIFYATDEYDGVPEYSGYLNVKDNDGAYCIMDPDASIFPIWTICSATRGQIGWRDTDGDRIQDIIDTFPDSKLIPYSPDPTYNLSPTYFGSIMEVPYPNNNPSPWSSGRDVTINTITNVEYRVDSGAWSKASADDGFFDEADESFTFTTSALPSGTHLIEARGKNSVGNIETSFAVDTITVLADLTSPTTSLSYSSPFYIKGATTYVSGKTRFELTASDTESGVANTYYKIDLGSWRLYAGAFTLSGIFDGFHTLYFYSVDNVENNETAKSFYTVVDNTGPTLSLNSPSNGTAFGSSNVSVSWTGSESGSGIDHYETKIDSGSYISKGTATSHMFMDVGEGNHKVYIKSFDMLGNSEELSVNFLVDVSRPTISIASPRDGSEIRSWLLTVAWSGLDEISGIDHYEVRLDGNVWINVRTNTTYKFAPVGDGSHTLHIKAIDKANNYQEVQINFSINTSLIGGPGWVDEAIVFGGISIVVAIAIGLCVKKLHKIK